MSATSRITVLALMISGVLVMLVGVAVMILARRHDVGVRTLFWAGSNAAAHPERYVRPDFLSTIRVLNLLGVGLFATGAIILAAEAAARLL